MTLKTITGAGVLMAATLTAGACSNTRDGAARDAEIAAQKSEQAAERSAETAREAGREAGAVAGDIGAEAREGMSEAGQAARAGAAGVAATGDAAQQTAQIKTALMADATIDSTDINVDTVASTKTVVLKGRVRTAAEKTRAARIAADKAPGYQVTNNLEVRR